MTPEQFLCNLTAMSRAAGVSLWACDNSHCCGGINLLTGYISMKDSQFLYESIMWDQEIDAYTGLNLADGLTSAFDPTGPEAI